VETRGSLVETAAATQDAMDAHGTDPSAGAVTNRWGERRMPGTASPPPKWDQEADVVIVGYGGAGAVTAIAAAEAHVSVIVLEKNPADGHFCNTNVSGGIFISPTDVDGAFQYIKACIGDTVNDAMCRLWAQQTSMNRDYVAELARSVGERSDLIKRGGAEFPALPGAEAITSWALASGPGSKLFSVLDKCVRARRNIRVEYSAPGRRLIQSTGGEVLGVLARRDGADIRVRGRRATILATGGYEYNEELKLNSLYGGPRYFYGPESNTGDGVLMAMAAGAGLWHMNWTSQHYGLAYKGFPVAFSLANGSRPFPRSSYIVVDQYGRRFFDETYNGHSAYAYLTFFDPVIGACPRIPSYLVFDESVRSMGRPLSGSRAPTGDLVGAAAAKYGYFWSNDQSKEIDRGWIMKADTIADLVQVIRRRQRPNDAVVYPSTVSMVPEILASSIATFNECAQQGRDFEFGRQADLLAPIVKPPLYATEVWPVGPNTQGGPKFDEKGRVLDVDGKPIPRLYKCGELGSIYGKRYTGGGNIAELLAFGRIAGRNAANEPSE
jgi:3-oxosteroid 1-dehydrogenase